ncbi:MAG: glycosyltransferase family 2 protein [Ferruginibacter sp.]
MIINKTFPASNEIAATRVTEKGLSFSPPVSAVIITYNEEHNIRRSLSQLAWCAEIVVVDSFSTDNTIAICKEFGCRIFSKKFDGYGAQKRFAVSKSSHDWVLCIDADEVLSDALVTEIKKSLTDNEGFAGFSFKMNLVFLNKEFLHGKESGRYFLRLFNKQKGGFSEDKVHESIFVSGAVKKLDQTIRHYSYQTLHQCMEKINRYSTYSAEIAFSKGKNKSLLAVLFGLPFNFFKYYLLELNCFNGYKGFCWSVFSSYYHFAKYVKLKELHETMKIGVMLS